MNNIELKNALVRLYMVAGYSLKESEAFACDKVQAGATLDAVVKGVVTDIERKRTNPLNLGQLLAWHERKLHRAQADARIALAQGKTPGGSNGIAEVRYALAESKAFFHAASVAVLKDAYSFADCKVR